jgi:transposase InsO family protein
MTEGYDGSKWVTHFLDDYTKMNFVYIQKSKGQITQTVQSLVALVRRQYKRDVQILRTDGETSLGNDFDTWIAQEEGIIAETSPPYTPAQNGSAERSGATLIRRARAIRIDATLPENLWPEAFIAAGYLTNRTPSKQLDWKTPFEILEQAINPDTPKQPNIAHLRVYGCRAYPLRYKIPPYKEAKTQSLYRISCWIRLN